MTSGDLVKVRSKGWEIRDIICVVVGYYGKPSYPSPSLWTDKGYWIINDGKQNWYYREEDMELISECRRFS